jgi:3-methyladenine DNA glycosylase AlkD
MYENVKKDLRKVASKEKAKVLAGFFKTGKGEYGEGDIFLGVTVPKSRIIAKKYADLSLAEIKKLLSSEIHEERLTALLILVLQYQKGGADAREKVFEFYVKNIRQVNNWDLVDLSAPRILGTHLFRCTKKMRAILTELSQSSNLWDRRVAILATFYFIKQGEFAPSIDIAKRLLNDKHDLIHKAIGWMLREVGKRDFATLETFLLEKGHYKKMPRTMLRYAIERFPEQKRKKYLLGVL